MTAQDRNGVAGERPGAAFFDLDKTLMAGSSAMHFGRAAYRHGFVSRRQLSRWGYDHLRYRLRGSTDDQTADAMATARVILSKMSSRDLERMAPEVLAGVLPRIYPEMLDEVRAHQDAGRKTFIVSAAGDGLVRMLAAVLAMDGGIGTSYAIGTNGAYTGELDGPFVYGEGKVAAMRRYAAEHDIDLAASYAYSDSVSDLPMLRCVGNPVAVNPDPPLAAIAKQERWRVIHFERLGRKLAIAGATAAAAAAGGSSHVIAARRRERNRFKKMRQRAG